MEKHLRRFNVPGLAFIVAVTLAWQLLAAHDLLTSYVPPPSTVFASMWRGLVVDGDISSQVGVTLLAYAESLALGASLAIIAGVLMGTFRPVYDAFKMIVEFMRPIPSVATIPLAILFFGLGDEMRVAVVTYAVFWLVLINTYYGVRGLDPLYRDVARNFGFSEAEILWKITLPSALATIATGFRIAASVALIVTITVELVAGNSGIGFYISQMEQANRLPPMYAAIVFTGILGYALNWFYVELERRIVFWTPAARARTA